jgi:hypothetical protein
MKQFAILTGAYGLSLSCSQVGGDAPQDPKDAS